MNKGVVCLGEALVDFIPDGADNIAYEKCMGGAPANVAVGLANLGVRSSFIGKTGRDSLGEFLVHTLRNKQVNVDNLMQTDKAKTGLVIVRLDDTNERDFEFFIQPSADYFLETADVKESFIAEHAILHIGSISLANEPIRSAALKAVEYAKANNLMISFDPNIRLSLWSSKEEVRQQIINIIAKVDIVKLSLDELQFLSDCEDIKQGVKKLFKENLQILLVTMGKQGTWTWTQMESIFVPSVDVVSVDTTGAGDAFMSAFLAQITDLVKDVNQLASSELEKIVRFANISGALSTTVKGAIDGLPDRREIEKLL